MAAESVTIETGINREKRIDGTRNSVRNVPTGKRAYLYRFSPFSGNFPVGRADEKFSIYCRSEISVACENIRFSSLFAAGDVSRGGDKRGEMDVFAG